MSGRTATTLEVLAPFDGTVVAVGEVPDPVFSEGLAGPGLALLPEPCVEPGRGRVVVASPCAGRLMSVYPHAVVVQVDERRSILVHLGVRTAGLTVPGGSGLPVPLGAPGGPEGPAEVFDVVVAAGQRVHVGEPLIAWDPAVVRASGRSSLSPLVALQARRGDVVQLVDDGASVREGQAVLLWS